MPGAVDLGNDLDEALGGVGDDAGVVLGGEVAAWTAVDVARPTDFGEQRPAGHRQPPSLVVGEMEMEDVDLVQRDQIDVAEHVVDAEEVAGDVEHRPAVLEAWPVSRCRRRRSSTVRVARRLPRQRREAAGAAS